MKNRMSKLASALLFTVLFLSSAIITAQSFELGLRYMPTFNNFDLQTSSGGTVKGKTTLGYGIGGLIAVNITNNIGIQGEIIYNTLSQKYKEVDTENKLNLRYLNIPLLFSLNSGKSNVVNFNLVAGPQIGLSVGTKITASTGGSANSDAILSVKKGDLGFAYGAGLDFGLKTDSAIRLTLGYRGVLGLIDISDNTNNASTNSYYILNKAKVTTNAAYVGLTFVF